MTLCGTQIIKPNELFCSNREQLKLSFKEVLGHSKILINTKYFETRVHREPWINSHVYTAVCYVLDKVLTEQKRLHLTTNIYSWDLKDTQSKTKQVKPWNTSNSSQPSQENWTRIHSNYIFQCLIDSISYNNSWYFIWNLSGFDLKLLVVLRFLPPEEHCPSREDANWSSAQYQPCMSISTDN